MGKGQGRGIARYIKMRRGKYRSEGRRDMSKVCDWEGEGRLMGSLH